MFSDITETFAKNKTRTNVLRLEDSIDRIFHKYTIALILILSGFITNQYVVNNSFNCFAPVSIGDEKLFNIYLNQYSWVNMRSSKFSFNQLNSHSQTPSVNYYYWIPFILFIQALIIWLPSQLWDYICRRSTGRDFIELINKAAKVAETNDEKDIDILHKEFRQILQENKQIKDESFCSKLKSIYKMRGKKLSVYYSLIMLIYFLIGIGQNFLMMNIFGYENPKQYFLSISDAIISGGFTKETPQFPRMIYTKIPDFLSLGGNVNLVAQCVLPMNMVIEKIVVILSIWFVFITILQIWKFISWIISHLFMSGRRDFVMKLLKLPIDNTDEVRKKIIDDFIESFLQRDGIFVLRMLCRTSTESVARNVALQMYAFYRKHTNRSIRRTE